MEPDSLKFAFLSDSELEKKTREYSELIMVAKSYIDQLAFSLTGITLIVASSDREGWIIDYRGTP